MPGRRLRLDAELVRRSLARSREHARELIERGRVTVNGHRATKAATAVAVDADLVVLPAPDGGVLDDLVVYRLSEDHYLVIANAANRDVVTRELAARAAEFDAAVALRDETQAGLIAIQGPAAAQIVEEAIGESVDGLAYYSCRPATVAEAV